MPFPHWHFNRPDASKRAPKPKKGQCRTLNCLTRPVWAIKFRIAEKQLMRVLEYESYLSYSDVERRHYDRDFVLWDWPCRLLSGLVVLVGFFCLGLFLDMTPMDRPSAIVGVHFVGAGSILAWLIWIWNYLRLEIFRARTHHYLRRSVKEMVSQL